MKKKGLFFLGLLLLTGILGTGCGVLDRLASGTLDAAYEEAYDNCLEKLDTLFPDARVNTSMVTVRYLNDEEEEQVITLDEVPENYFSQNQDRLWVFTIGNTSGYEFVQLVCNSRTNEVIGYLPVE